MYKDMECSFLALCDNFRHCEIFSEKILIFFLHPRPRVYILRPRIFITPADGMTYCYVKRLCNSLKKLIRKYKNGQTIKTIIKTYKGKDLVCIRSSSTIPFG